MAKDPIFEVPDPDSGDNEEQSESEDSKLKKTLPKISLGDTNELDVEALKEAVEKAEPEEAPASKADDDAPETFTLRSLQTQEIIRADIEEHVIKEQAKEIKVAQIADDLDLNTSENFEINFQDKADAAFNANDPKVDAEEVEYAEVEEYEEEVEYEEEEAPEMASAGSSEEEGL
ncbi:MAG: hypothetical protein HRT89_14205, partial [Lentisphaeria bacterium]|nr:hypothetical protein [Lentisphaeria bacterium]NQZ69209.1 hypothetical protein [Lentisphaeria bacterium]